jgi:hypothetical protein
LAAIRDPHQFRKGTTVNAIRQFEASRLRPVADGNGRIRVAGVDLRTPSGELDVTWLKAASDAYNISADPRDYVLSEVPLVTADFPNRNLDGFPFDSLTEFRPILGRVTYQTFLGKPTHQDHDNQEPLKAKGVIFDASLRPVTIRGAKGFKVFILGGWDRTKDHWLANQVLTGKRPGHSMGALVGRTRCSWCNNMSDGTRYCTHIGPRRERKGRIIQGRLVYEDCYDVNFIEDSSVDDPADVDANQVLVW